MKTMDFPCKLVLINRTVKINTENNKCLHDEVKVIYVSLADIIIDKFLDVTYPITVDTDLCTTISEISQYVQKKYATCTAYVLMYTPDWDKIPLTASTYKYIGAEVDTDMRVGVILNSS
jgi:hypothetical protein